MEKCLIAGDWGVNTGFIPMQCFLWTKGEDKNTRDECSSAQKFKNQRYERGTDTCEAKY